jgi:general secretion pathway protein N
MPEVPVRFADAGPRTWLVASVAGWALFVWVLALGGMGAPIARLPDDATLLRKLPVPARPQAERIGPLDQYAETGTRPLFSEDRRPQPFSLQPQGEGEPAQAFDFVLTSVLLTPQVQMAIVQPTAGGESIRMKLDEAPAEAQGWRLVSVEPRSAVFEGPQGEKRLELRTYDGSGGQPPTRRAVNGAPPQQPITMQDADEAPAPAPEPTPSPPQQAATNPPATVGSTLPETPMTPEAQMEAIRKRIEERRAQLREEAKRQQQPQPTQNPAQ